MNHAKQYSNLINKALTRNPVPGVFYEKHHILPRSLGGKDDPSNLVLLTVHEHFIAHLLLAHIPGYEDQWFSVAAILDDTINANRPWRFLHPKLRYKKWIRKRISLRRAANLRQRAKGIAAENYIKRMTAAHKRYETDIQMIEQKYAGRILDSIFDTEVIEC